MGGVAPAAPAGRHLVYELVNRTTNQVDYVGITTNATLRWFVHRLRFRNHRMVEISGMSGLAKVEARGVEQVLIEYYGRRGIDTGGQLYNKYNSIALKKPYYGPATRAGLGRLYREGYQF